MQRILPASFGIYFLQTVWPGGDELKTDILASRLQLFQTFRLPFRFASLRDRYIQHLHSSFTHDPQCNPTNDALIIRMRSKEKSLGRIRRDCRSRDRLEAAQWK